MSTKFLKTPNSNALKVRKETEFYQMEEANTLVFLEENASLTTFTAAINKIKQSCAIIYAVSFHKPYPDVGMENRW
jgi:hypothetical protein